MNVDKRRLFQIYTNAHKMLKARKVDIKKNTKIESSEKQFWERFKESDIITLSDDGLTILYVDKSSNFIKDIFMGIMLHISTKYKTVKNVIMVINKKISKTIEKYKSSYQSYRIEFLNYNMFDIDKSKHVLVPEHILLSEDEKKDFLRGSTLLEKDLPKILSSDPMSKWYGAKRGQIFKVIYEGKCNTLKRTEFRIVV